MTELQNNIAQLPVALADLPNVLVPMLRAFASIFAYRDSVQYIIDLHAIPVPPSVSGSDYIKVGALSTDISAPVITSDYVDIDCGALSISEQFQNFLDYMVSCKLFLPFIGFIDIKPELWNGGTIGVKYRFNVIVARPKKLFVKVFARTNRIGFQFLNEKYSSFFKKV